MMDLENDAFILQDTTGHSTTVSPIPEVTIHFGWIQDLEELYQSKPRSLFFEDQLSQYMKVLHKQSRKKSNQQSYPAVKPVNHNNNKQGKIAPMVKQWCLSLRSNQELYNWTKGPFSRKKEIHAWYYKPSQQPMASDVMGPKKEPTITMCLN